MCDHRQRVCGCPDGLLIHCDPVGSLHLERGRTARLLQDLAYRRSVCSSSTCSQARSVYKIRLALLILSLFRTISLTWVLCLPTVGTAHTMESGYLLYGYLLCDCTFLHCKPLITSVCITLDPVFYIDVPLPHQIQCNHRGRRPGASAATGIVGVESGGMAGRQGEVASQQAHSRRGNGMHGRQAGSGGCCELSCSIAKVHAPA
jgi:hypothetical protein